MTVVKIKDIVIRHGVGNTKPGAQPCLHAIGSSNPWKRKSFFCKQGTGLIRDDNIAGIINGLFHIAPRNPVIGADSQVQSHAFECDPVLNVKGAKISPGIITVIVGTKSR